VNVNVRPAGNVVHRKANGLTVLDDRLAGPNGAHGHLVPHADPLGHSKSAAIELHVQSGREYSGGDGDIVRRPEMDADFRQWHGRHGGLGRRRDVYDTATCSALQTSTPVRFGGLCGLFRERTRLVRSRRNFPFSHPLRPCEKAV
jgi:hypothetical protein